MPPHGDIPAGLEAPEVYEKTPDSPPPYTELPPEKEKTVESPPPYASNSTQAEVRVHCLMRVCLLTILLQKS